MEANRDIKAERYVLGAIIIERSTFSRVSQFLSSEYFSDSHALIYKACEDLALSSTAIDMMTVIDQLKKNDAEEDSGGFTYIADMVNGVSSSANVEFHALIVAERFFKYEMGKLGESLTDKSKLDKEDLREMIDMTVEKCFSVIESINKFKGGMTFKDSLDDSFEQLQRAAVQPDNMIGTPCGSSKLDAITAGFRKGNLIILAARPSVGKSVQMLRWCIHAAKNGHSVYMANLEMSMHQINERLFAAEATINMGKITTGKGLNQLDWDALVRIKEELARLPITIEENPMATVHDIQAGAKRHKLKFGSLGMIAIDYLQLIPPPKGHRGNRENEVSYNSAYLKRLSKELNVPVVALAQLSRKLEQRPDKRPILSDLRESGSIEQDADVVLSLFRPSLYDENPIEPYDGLPGDVYAKISEIGILKNRNGSLGRIVELFEGQFAKFREYEEFFEQEMKPIDDVQF